MPRDIQLRVLHRPTIPLDLSLDIFITAKEAERCTPRTIRTYRFLLEQFRDWLLGEKFGKRMEILGGLILVGIGVRILFTHLS